MAKQQIVQRLNELKQDRPNYQARVHQLRGQLEDTEKQLSSAETDLARLDTTIAELDVLLQAWQDEAPTAKPSDVGKPAEPAASSPAAQEAIAKAEQKRESRKARNRVRVSANGAAEPEPEPEAA